MPASGGSADKLGNRYEALWAIAQLLQIVDRAAHTLTLEPLDPDESRGIEFVVVNADGVSYYWSVKRQTTRAAGWTLAELSTKDKHGRSILDDLLKHVERNLEHRSVFASTLGAGDFKELRAHAETVPLLKERLERSAKLKANFDKYILPLCGGDLNRARIFLLRTQTHAVDEAYLRDQDVNFRIRKLFYAEGGSCLDFDAVRGYLADLLLDNINRPINREAIIDAMASHGVRLSEWAVEKSVRNRIEEMCQEYTAPLRSQRINGTLLSLTDSPPFPNTCGSVDRNVLIVGGAGSGKSTELASQVENLTGSGLPVLPIRFDQLPEGILTTTELGDKLLLPESPAVVLAGVAHGAASVLIIDQLDAVSLASGRRTELWSLFERLCQEAGRFPKMWVVAGCREFDLENDYRLRKMKDETSGFQIVKVKPLSTDQVDNALRDSGLEPIALQESFKSVLSVPLHLSMFLRLPPDGRTDIRNRDELFDRFWTESERQTDKRLGRKVAWAQVIDKLANWLSKSQELSAPRYVLDEFSADAAAMASEGVLVIAEDRYRFFHESFFDYAFARRFVAEGGRLLVDLLLASEQHLFRRAQARQVLSYLRVQDPPRYHQELRSVLSSADVRFHIKRLVLEWLGALPDPQRQEWDLLQELIDSEPELHFHVRGVIFWRAGWFDVIDSAGFFDAALASGDEKREQEAVWMLGQPLTYETRSPRVAELLRQHRKSNDPWNRYLRQICSRGNIYHSRELFELFLSLIDDGTFDYTRTGFGGNVDLWSLLYRISKHRPDLACETIARWFDRALITWQGGTPTATTSSDMADSPKRSLGEHLDQSRNGASIILDAAARSPRSYVEHLLPRVTDFVDAISKECGGLLKIDPLWFGRSFGDNQLLIDGALLSGMATSLEALAKTVPADLDRLLEPYVDRPHDTIAFLVLRAWAAAPGRYADRLADYLTADPRRLKVGYASSGGGGSVVNYVSERAVVAASRCSGGCQGSCRLRCTFTIFERSAVAEIEELGGLLTW